jgi:hypothetical protein
LLHQEFFKRFRIPCTSGLPETPLDINNDDGEPRIEFIKDRTVE